MPFPRTVLCPFCFHPFLTSRMLFRCIIPTCTGQVPDEIYAQAHTHYTHDSQAHTPDAQNGHPTASMGRILFPRKRFLGSPDLREVSCDICHTMSRTHLCPHCHFTLPHDIGQIDYRMITILGGRATGKTHYIAALIHYLQHATGKQFGLTMHMLGDETQRRWEHDFYTPLFLQKRTLPTTQSATQDERVKTPLLLRFTFIHGHAKHALDICFFDTSGEDMTSLAMMSLQNHYMCLADGLILLLDPLQIPAIRQNITTLPPLDPLSAPSHMVALLQELFEQEQHIRNKQKAKTPVAFTLSKVDTLLPLLEPGSEFHHSSEHPGYVDLDDLQSVHTEIESYFASWMGPRFNHFIHNNFAHYHYFGVSSLGEQPGADNQVSAVSSLRVEDPFLWILYQLKLIPGKKSLKDRSYEQ